MKQFWVLLRVQLNVRFGLSQLRGQWHTNKKRFIGSLLLGLVILFGAGSLVATYAAGVYFLLRAVRGFADVQQVLLALLFVLVPITILLTGVLTVLSVLFFGRDTEFLATLPVPQRTVFAAKFTQVLLLEYLFVLALLLPPMICYPGDGSLGYGLRCAVLLLSAPCLPLALAAVLSMALMRFSVLWRHRDLALTLGSLALLIGYFVGQNLLMQRLPQEFDAAMVLRYLLGKESLARTITAWFPPAAWAVQAMAGQGTSAWLGTLWTLVSSALALAAVLALAQRLYYQGALAMLEQAQRSSRGKAGRQRWQPRSAFFAIFRREWRIILRTPVYAVNSLTGVIMPVLLLSMPTLFSGIDQAEMAEVLAMLRGEAAPALVILILTALVVFFAAINPAAGTVLSREGGSVWMSQAMPQPARVQVLAKYGFGLSISLAAVGSFALALRFLWHLEWGVALMVLLISLLLVAHIDAVAVLIDLRWPNFTWEKPTQIIKQSKNALLGTLYGLVLVLVLGGAVYWGASCGVAWSQMVFGIALLAGVLCAASFIGLVWAAPRAYARLAGE